MANNVYEVEEKKIDGKLILFLVFLGWFGIDKFYAAKSFKGGWKFALVKFLYNIIGLGELWNIFDIIQALRKKYELDFREYFR
jgi:TM2 domain-containing membrane protein YozV